MRARTLRQKERLVQEFADYALPRFKDNSFKPVVGKTFPLAEANAAHELLESAKQKGKIILTIEH